MAGSANAARKKCVLSWRGELQPAHDTGEHHCQPGQHKSTHDETSRNSLLLITDGQNSFNDSNAVVASDSAVTRERSPK